MGRSEGRVLADEDIDARKLSIDQDLAFIRENHGMINRSFGIIIDNGDGHSIESTCDTILSEVGLGDLAFEDARG